MRDHHKPAGLILRGGIWHLDKVIRTPDGRRIRLRESAETGEIAEAVAILARRLDEIANQCRPVDRERTFAEAAVEYVLDLEARGKDSRRAEMDVRMIAAAIGHLPLSHVHQGTIKDWIAGQRGHRASGTVARTLRTITAVLNLAARVLRDGNRPWLAVAVPKLRAPDWGKRQPTRLSWEEQDRLVAALPAHLVAPVLFAVATGAREREVGTLRWDQERRVEGLPPLAVWWIPPEIRKANAKRSISEQEGRFVVCNGMARAILAAQPRTGLWVFPSPKTGAPLYRIGNTAWHTALKTAGLCCRFHDLRHTFGERLATAGVPFDARKTILGHHHGDITAHYSTPGLSRLLEEAEKVRRPTAALVSIPLRRAG